MSTLLFFLVAWRPSKTAILCAFNKQYSENHLIFSAKRLVKNAITIYFALFVELKLLFSLKIKVMLEGNVGREKV